MKADSVVWNFNERLEYSATLSDEKSWFEFYLSIWPDMISATRLDAHSEFQRRGIDRVVYRECGQQHTIDEKKREKDYGDFLLEEWSVARILPNGNIVGEKAGWCVDPHKHCDFIAYAIPSANKCYFLPFELLRSACIKNLPRWKTPQTTKVAQNHGYVTVNVSVRWAELKVAIVAETDRHFYKNVNIQTAPVKVGNQLEITFFDEGQKNAVGQD